MHIAVGNTNHRWLRVPMLLQSHKELKLALPNCSSREVQLLQFCMAKGVLDVQMKMPTCSWRLRKPCESCVTHSQRIGIPHPIVIVPVCACPCTGAEQRGCVHQKGACKEQICV